MTEQCRACRLGLEHCHGALIHHPFQRPECTEDDCFVSAADHDLHIDCNATGCLCEDLAARLTHRVG